MAKQVKPQPGWLPPRVIEAYARLTNTIPKYDVAADQFNFVEPTMRPVRSIFLEEQAV